MTEDIKEIDCTPVDRLSERKAFTEVFGELLNMIWTPTNG